MATVPSWVGDAASKISVQTGQPLDPTITALHQAIGAYNGTLAQVAGVQAAASDAAATAAAKKTRMLWYAVGGVALAAGIIYWRRSRG